MGLTIFSLRYPCSIYLEGAPWVVHVLNTLGQLDGRHASLQGRIGALPRVDPERHLQGVRKAVPVAYHVSNGPLVIPGSPAQKAVPGMPLWYNLKGSPGSSRDK